MEKLILKEKKKITRIGNSMGVILPRWWLKDGTKEVELEVFPDKIVIRKRKEVRE